MKTDTSKLKKNIVALAKMKKMSLSDMDRLFGKSAGYTSRLVAANSDARPGDDVFRILHDKFCVNENMLVNEELDSLGEKELESFCYMDEMICVLRDSSYVSDKWKGSFYPNWKEQRTETFNESFAFGLLHESEWGLKIPGTNEPIETRDGKIHGFDSEESLTAYMCESCDFDNNSRYFYIGDSKCPSVFIYSYPVFDFVGFKGKSHFGINYSFTIKDGKRKADEYVIYDSWNVKNQILDRKFYELLHAIEEWIARKAAERTATTLAEYETSMERDGEQGGTFFSEYLRKNSIFCSLDSQNASHDMKYVDFLNEIDADDDVKDIIAARIVRKINGRRNEVDDELWLDNVMRLPWNQASDMDFDIKKALDVIERSHYGMRNVKDRIREILAVMKRSGSDMGMVICLDGPPGVGKTSIAKSIAAALGRKFVSLSVPGLDDNLDVLGERESYKAAGPGQIMNALINAGTSNPVMLLDEIDKAKTSESSRTPIPALLGVLDPSQNSRFRDTYFGFAFDLSHVIFILTSNDFSRLPKPLLDRMELVRMSGYTESEKKHILSGFLLKKVREKNGYGNAEINISDEAANLIVHEYATEPGVRGLEKALSKIARRHVSEHVLSAVLPDLYVDVDYVKSALGRSCSGASGKISAYKPGTALGLSVSEAGGAVLRVEIASFAGSGRLDVTGRLGSVIRESIDVAFAYMKSLLTGDRSYSGFFEKRDFHLHIPEGSISKDGPSAGITFVAALYSLYTGKATKSGLAMTGEVNLCGEVMPVGGIREKFLGAMAGGITDIILPMANMVDVDELDEEIKKGINVHPVKDVEEIFNSGLLFSE